MAVSKRILRDQWQENFVPDVFVFCKLSKAMFLLVFQGQRWTHPSAVATGGYPERIVKIDKSREAMRPSGGVTGWTISLSRKGYRFSKEKSEEHVLKLKQQPHATPKSNRKVFYQMFFSALLFDLLAIFGNIKTNTLCFFIAKPDGCRASECHVRSVKVERDSACSRKMRGL